MLSVFVFAAKRRVKGAATLISFALERFAPQKEGEGKRGDVLRQGARSLFLS